jgi:hypothetical protein
MYITRTFRTSSSPKYLKTRTVSLPADLVENCGSNDAIRIIIATPKSGDIEFTTTGALLQTRAEPKQKEGRKFYVLNY